jgi:type I restriction enzyme M protein
MAIKKTELHSSLWASCKDKNGEAIYEETPDLVIDKKKYKADLISPSLLIARYFSDKQAHIDQLQADLDAINQELEALIEEHSGEEGVLVDAQTDAGKVTKASIAARLKEIQGAHGPFFAKVAAMPRRFEA